MYIYSLCSFNIETTIDISMYFWYIFVCIYRLCFMHKSITDIVNIFTAVLFVMVGLVRYRSYVNWL